VVFLSASPELDEHRTGFGHPERPERVPAALAGLERAGLLGEVKWLAPREASREELQRVHTAVYIDSLKAFCEAGGGHLDADTVASSGSWGTALRAVGGALAVVEAVQATPGAVGFVAHRPPGHHATSDEAMGFCLLNTIAVAAATLAGQGERPLVLDWDVHHGNGTEAIFWDDPRVLYASVHQVPLYPGTGPATATGGPGAPGLTVNVPLPPGATGDVVLYALDEVVAPVAESWGPTWVLVSCGFDAHRSDPLAQLMLSAADYYEMGKRAKAMAGPAGKVVAVLEGGYDLEAIAMSTGAVVSALAGGRFQPEEPTSGGPGKAEVDFARRLHSGRA
jgi:acetoin utilization deacetylase AcuC-like enzyme